MADFDPQDIIQPVAAVKPAPAVAPTQDFDPADVHQEQAAKPDAAADFDQADVAEDPKYTALQGVMNRSYWAAPGLFSEPTSEDDIETIAKHHGVDPDELKNVSSFMGVPGRNAEDPLHEAGQELAGSIGRGVGLGLPQFIVKKQQEDPKFREAIDDLIHLTDQRRSFARGLGEAAPMFGLSKVAKVGFGKVATALEEPVTKTVSNLARLKQVPAQVAKGSAGGAGVGAIGGLAKSREGEEVESIKHGAETGAVVGGVVAGAAEGIGTTKNYYKNKANNATEDKLAAEVSRAKEMDIETGKNELAAENTKSDKIIQDVVSGQKTVLNPTEVQEVVQQKLGQEQLEQHLNPNTVEGKAIRERLDNLKEERSITMPTDSYGDYPTEQAIPRLLADDIIENAHQDLAHDITGVRPANFEEASTAIRDYGRNEGGAEQIASRYQDLRDTNYRMQSLANLGTKTENQPGLLGKAANFPSASGPMFRYFQDKYTVPLEKEHTMWNQAVNRMSWFKAKLQGLRSAVLDNASKLGQVADLQNEEGGKVYNAFRTGDFSGLSQKEEQAAKDVRSMFRISRQEANGLERENDPRITPMSIQEARGGDYLPDKPLPSHLGVPKIQRAIANTNESLGISSLADIPEEDFVQLRKENAEVDQLAKVAEFYAKEKNLTPKQVASTLDSVTNSRNRFDAYETKAGAAISREGGEGIPELIKDKNIARLMNSWINDVSKHMYLRGNVNRLNKLADVIEKAGGKYEAEYIRNNVKDVIGVRQGTMSEATRWMKSELNRKMDFMIDRVGPESVRAVPFKMIKGMPVVLDWLSSQLYTNAFYMNTKNYVQHQLAAYTSLAPYLSGPYGYEVVTRSLPEAILHLKANLAEAADRGYIANNLSRNLEIEFTDSFSNSVARNGQKATDAVNRVGLLPLHFGVDSNRALSIVVGKNIALDLAARKPRAMMSLRSFSPVLRQEILANIDKPEVSGKLIADNLNSAALMHYNKASMSEMGRVLGPALTAFTRLPTQLWGEALYDIRARGLPIGAVKTTERLMGPFALLWGAHKMYSKATGNAEPTDREKLIVGNKGLEGLTPVAHLQHVLPKFMGGEGGLQSPPVLKVAESLMSPLHAKDKEDMMSKIERATDETYRIYGPQSGLDRFLLQTVPTIITGHAPEGKTNIEKMQSGAQTWKKLVK